LAWWPHLEVSPSWSSSSRSSPNYWRNFDLWCGVAYNDEYGNHWQSTYPAFCACADLW
jgi:hypothetical protein